MRFINTHGIQRKRNVDLALASVFLSEQKPDSTTSNDFIKWLGFNVRSFGLSYSKSDNEVGCGIISGVRSGEYRPAAGKQMPHKDSLCRGWVLTNQSWPYNGPRAVPVRYRTYAYTQDVLYNHVFASYLGIAGSAVSEEGYLYHSSDNVSVNSSVTPFLVAADRSGVIDKRIKELYTDTTKTSSLNTYSQVAGIAWVPLTVLGSNPTPVSGSNASVGANVIGVMEGIHATSLAMAASNIGNVKVDYYNRQNTTITGNYATSIFSNPKPTKETSYLYKPEPEAADDPDADLKYATMAYFVSSFRFIAVLERGIDFDINVQTPHSRPVLKLKKKIEFKDPDVLSIGGKGAVR